MTQGKVRDGQEVSVKVGKYRELSGMPPETFKKVRMLMDVGGYTLTAILEAGIAAVDVEFQRSLANGPCACGNPMSDCRDCNDGGA